MRLMGKALLKLILYYHIGAALRIGAADYPVSAVGSVWIQVESGLSIRIRLVECLLQRSSNEARKEDDSDFHLQ